MQPIDSYLRQTRFVFCVLFVTLLSVQAETQAPPQITVSGLSSGAFMALQLQVAFSSRIQGAALFAGGPYYCAGLTAGGASTCIDHPETIDPSKLRAQALSWSLNGLIENVENLKSARVLLFHGTDDPVVRFGSLEKTKEFLKPFLTPGSLRSIAYKQIGHGWPSLTGTVPCEDTNSPFINRCDVSGAELTFAFLFERRKEKPQGAGSLKPIPQSQFLFSKFTRAQTGLAKRAWLYTPKACVSQHCPLHVVLHGCRQSEEFVNDAFMQQSGFLSTADAYQVRVLFPQTETSFLNPRGCWDWWGYTGNLFATREGVQMKALWSLVEQVY